MTHKAPVFACLVVSLAAPRLAPAQSLGTFRWQLLPYCNVLTVAVTQTGGVYRLEGTDDQCGGGRDLAAVQGLAFPNPDGTIGFGMTIVTAPGGAPVHVDAEITMATLGGTWRDSAGTTGTFRFTPGTGTGGSPRPPATAAIPPAFSFAPTGNFLATGMPDVGTAPASGPGVRMMWYAGKAAFRAGRAFSDEWDDAMTGRHSAAFGSATRASGLSSTAMGASTTASNAFDTAMGFQTTASGGSSTAMGASTTASGQFSTAMGASTTASEEFSTAMGLGTLAIGSASTALGNSTLAQGPGSTAMGLQTRALGDYSVATGDQTLAAGHRSTAMGLQTLAGGAVSLAAGSNTSATGDFSTSMGTNASTNAQRGSFIYGDGSTTASGAVIGNDAPNQFMVRAAGGYKFFTRSDLSTGAILPANASAWSVLSDARTKEAFRELDHEDILSKIAGMPVREWSYVAQGPSIRHVGPTAQDFHAAFGLGEDPLRISTVDADGVALAGVRALEARTRALQAEVELLRQRLDALTAASPPVRER